MPDEKQVLLGFDIALAAPACFDIVELSKKLDAHIKTMRDHGMSIDMSKVMSSTDLKRNALSLCGCDDATLGVHWSQHLYSPMQLAILHRANMQAVRQMPRKLKRKYIKNNWDASQKHNGPKIMPTFYESAENLKMLEVFDSQTRTRLRQNVMNGTFAFMYGTRSETQVQLQTN